jgi:hypothetical protein
MLHSRRPVEASTARDTCAARVSTRRELAPFLAASTHDTFLDTFAADRRRLSAVTGDHRSFKVELARPPTAAHGHRPLQLVDRNG